MASRARLEALQNKNHLIDSEIIFSYPTKISELEPYLTIESGQTTALNFKQTTFATGLAHIDTQSSIAVSLGRQNDLSSAQRYLFNQITSEFFEFSQNPIQLMWSNKNKGQSYALGLYYSHHHDNLNQAYESTQVLHGGYRAGFLSVAMAVQLVNEVQDTSAKKLNLNDSASMSVLYEIDNLVASGGIESFSATQKNSGVEVNSIEHQNFQMALSDRTDFDNNHFFYRVDLLVQSLKYKISDLKQHENQLSFTLGIESEYSDWLVLRSSLKQTLLINQFENVPAAGNNTQAAFGAGFKFDNFIIDGTFSGLIGSAQAGVLSGNQFLSEVAITSTF